VVIAFDFDWHYVPESASALLMSFGGALGLLWTRATPVGRYPIGVTK
jgi:hypothetical protein